MSRRILRMQGMRIRRMVATRARMFPFPSDVVGEDITTTTEITVGIAMGGIRDGIAGDIRGGIGKRQCSFATSTRNAASSRFQS
jgi:hypothetical protein